MNPPSYDSQFGERSAPSAASETFFNYGIIATFVGFAVYSITVSLNLLGQRVPLERAFLLMLPLPLGTALWQFAAFLRAGFARDWGLLVSAFGWLIVVFALWDCQAANMRLFNQGIAFSRFAPSAFFWFLLALGFSLLVVGAILSFTYWRELRGDPNSRI